VYPGFVQLSAFVSMNLQRHVDSLKQMYKYIAEGQPEQAEATKRFYEEYFAVADLAAGVRGRLVVTTPDPGDAARVLKEQGAADVVATDDRVTAEPPDRDLAEVNAALVTAGVRVRGFGLERASLEDAFVALTGEGFDVAG